jgi:hypothetical protein
MRYVAKCYCLPSVGKRRITRSQQQEVKNFQCHRKTSINLCFLRFLFCKLTSSVFKFIHPFLNNYNVQISYKISYHVYTFTIYRERVVDMLLYKCKGVTSIRIYLFIIRCQWES